MNDVKIQIIFFYSIKQLKFRCSSFYCYPIEQLYSLKTCIFFYKFEFIFNQILFMKCEKCLTFTSTENEVKNISQHLNISLLEISVFTLPEFTFKAGLLPEKGLNTDL